MLTSHSQAASHWLSDYFKQYIRQQLAERVQTLTGKEQFWGPAYFPKCELQCGNLNYYGVVCLQCMSATTAGSCAIWHGGSCLCLIAASSAANAWSVIVGAQQGLAVNTFSGSLPMCRTRAHTRVEGHSCTVIRCMCH